MKVTALRKYQSLRVYIDDTLHVDFLMDNYTGMQSWKEGTKRFIYKIEIYFKRGAPMLLGYDAESLWKEVLTTLDSNL